MNCFFRKKMKKLTDGDPKTASKLSKPIKQSKIITKQAETVKKPNIVDIESVSLEQPKTATNFTLYIY